MDPTEVRPWIPQLPWREPRAPVEVAAAEVRSWISRHHDGEAVEPHTIVDLADLAAAMDPAACSLLGEGEERVREREREWCRSGRG